MRSLLVTTLAISTTALTFVACSGGGGGGASSGDGFGSATSAQFIDAPVKGLTFKNASGANGKTAAQGKFNCARGEVVSFELKGFKLGSAPCSDKIFVQDLFAPSVGGTGYTWQKAASIIQSFATGTTELDISAANADTSAVSLSTVNYDAGFTNLSGAVSAAVSGGVTGISHKDETAAGTAAENALADHAALDSAFGAALDLFIADPSTAGGKFVVKAALASGTKIAGTEWCDLNVEALMQIIPETKGVENKKVYKLKTLQAISYNEASDANTDVTCKSSPNPTTCRDVNSKMIPAEKYISGAKFDVATFAPEIIKYRDVQGFNISSNTIVSMSAAAGVDDIKISGTFYNDFTVLDSATDDFAAYKGQTVKCLYKIQ